LVAAVTVAVLAADALTGTRLQIDSLLGYNPLVAGRFTGLGNLAFAVLGAAALVLAAIVAVLASAADARARRGKRMALTVVAAVGVLVLAVDGAPAWGADFGGVLTLIPAFVVLASLVAGVRVRPLRLLASGAVAALVAGAVGLVDAVRPPAERSHFGRFAAGLLDGSAVDTVSRKASANVDLLFAGPHTVAAFVAAVALSWWVLRDPPALTAAYARAPALRPALLSTLALAWIGFVTNDSGVAIPVVAAMVAVPAAALILASHPQPSSHRPETLLTRC
jgi:hypothetical protein